MSELSRFKKFLGGLGKRLYHMRETKESINFLSYMYETILEEYADIFGGDYERSMDHLIELVRPMSEEVIAKLLLEVKVAGVEFKSLITTNIDDWPYLTETVLYAVFGSWAQKVFKKPILIYDTESFEHVHTIILKLNECPFCCNTMIPPKKLGAHKYGKLLCLTIEQMMQCIQDYAGLNFKVVGRETRCYHAGDSEGEMRIWFYPNDDLELMEKNDHLKKIK